MRRLLLVLAAVAAGAWILLDSGTPRDPVAHGREAAARAADFAPQAPRAPEALPPRAPLPETAADPFLAPSRGAPHPARPQVAAAAPVPPLPFRFVGRVTQQGATQVYVARGAKLLEVRQGDVIDGEYRVDALDPGAIAFVHLRSGTRQVMPLSPPVESAARPPGWLNALMLDHAPAGAGGAP